MGSITFSKSLSVLAFLGTAVFQAQGYVLSSPHPTITEAPKLHAQLLERQDNYVTCSEWSYINGGQPACDSGLTCLYEYPGSFEACLIPSATQAIFTTACLDYPTTWDGQGTDPVQTSFCPAESPSCGAVFLEADDGTTYTNVGCGTTAFYLTAIQIAPLPWEISTSTSFPSTTSSTTPSTIPTTAPTPSTTPSPTPFASSTTSASPVPTQNQGNKVDTAATIGGSIGGVVGGLGALAGGLATWYYLRKKHQRQKREQASREAGVQSPFSSPMQSPHESLYKPPFSSMAEYSAPARVSAAC